MCGIVSWFDFFFNIFHFGKISTFFGKNSTENTFLLHRIPFIIINGSEKETLNNTNTCRIAEKLRKQLSYFKEYDMIIGDFLYP